MQYFSDFEYVLRMQPIKRWLREKITLHDHESRSEEKANALTHILGAFTALYYLIWTVVKTTHAGMIIHASALIVLYGCSATYHLLEQSDTKRLFRLLDHSTIYLLIAATYTPVLMKVQDSRTQLLITIWAIAVAGILFSVLFWGKFKILHVATYLAMGWFIVPLWSKVAPFLPPALIGWIIGAGVTYTAGVVLYALKRIAYAHAVWHLFCMAAGLLFSFGFALHLVS